mgnify:CR=1 FL=1
MTMNTGTVVLAVDGLPTREIAWSMVAAMAYFDRFSDDYADRAEDGITGTIPLACVDARITRHYARTVRS